MKTFKQKSKLGKTTGSLFNYLMGNNMSIPEVGKGATRIWWTDRSAYEVMEVSKDLKRVVLKEYNAKRIDNNGMSESQEYEYKELNEYETILVWRYGKWNIETNVIEYNKKYRDLCKSLHFSEWAEIIGELNVFNEHAEIQLVEGVTERKKKYNPINIIFGVKMAYHDYSF